MRLAFWTPRATGWPAELGARLAEDCELVAVAREPSRAVEADLDLYHVASDAAHGFVYRALQREPGLVLLEDWNLHALVFAETAGRGDAAAYRRETRRAHGPLGSFVSEQVLRGLGGELPTLTPTNLSVLESSLATATTATSAPALACAGLLGRPLVRVPLVTGEAPDAAEAAPDLAALAGILLRLARELAPLRQHGRSALARERARQATALGRAEAELAPFARELGLPRLPGLTPLLVALFAEEPPDGR